MGCIKSKCMGCNKSKQKSDEDQMKKSIVTTLRKTLCEGGKDCTHIIKESHNKMGEPYDPNKNT